jgi:hypothetical protein
MSKSKDEIKQFAEEFLEKLNEQELVKQVAWVIEAFPLSDLRDVAIGYVIGLTVDRFESIRAFQEIFDDRKRLSQDYDVLMAVFKEKLPKIIEKIEKEFCE